MGSSTPDITVIILCYKAEQFVPVFVDRMKRVLEQRSLQYELVLVANYDEEDRQDRTPAIAAELARHDSTIQVVSRPKQGMMGWDMRSGMEVASGKAIALIDGDGQMPAEDIVTVYDRLRQGAYDMVNTYRTKRYDGLQRSVISGLYNVILKLLFPAVRVKDANSKPKIFTREALQRLNLQSGGWFIDAEMIILASYLGFRIGETPTTFYANEHRRSFVGMGAVLEFARELVRYRFTLGARIGGRT
jgi:glycosyltransferase involved in cell wall biosynthesis